jgi:hypothetical protein
MDQIKTVTIPQERHEGFYSMKVKVKWVCPKCGAPRGEVFQTRSYDGSLYMGVDGWRNDCGHIDYYSDVREEAKSNGLNIATAATADLSEAR